MKAETKYESVGCDRCGKHAFWWIHQSSQACPIFEAAGVVICDLCAHDETQLFYFLRQSATENPHFYHGGIEGQRQHDDRVMRSINLGNNLRALERNYAASPAKPASPLDPEFAALFTLDKE